jgi:phosphoribosyl-ATP pyrophosphohydrolase/phosphoribosyl-AMP cyclohydrolase
VIVCSIDLMDGKAVQLQRGERLVLERDDVLDLARRFGRLGEVAVIDLDAALGRGENRALIERLCATAPCRVGGGIRDAESARRWLRAGARRVILGTAASESLLRQLPRDRTIVAIDARDDRVTTRGWRAIEEESPVARARRLRAHCGGFLFTDVENEGMLGGIDIPRAVALREAVDAPLIFAGGITSSREICALDAAGIDAQVGMAIYTGALDPVEAFVDVLNFDRGGGLLPTIVCDARGASPRMLAYSSRDSLRAALREGNGIYWSRSRNAFWRKGETSGCTQRLVRAQPDCDRDAVLFFVEQQGATCHTGAARCFDDLTYSWQALNSRIDERLSVADAHSYTCRLAGDPALLNEKIAEEAQEVVTARTREELAWECADLLYFLSVKMRAAGIAIEDVMHQLAARAVDR